MEKALIEKISSRLREIREDNLYSKTAFAKLFGISRSAYWRYEAGLLPPPFKLLLAINARFGCTLDYLCGSSDDFYGYYMPAVPELVRYYFSGSL